MGYWDAPDGKECIEKTAYTTKLGAGLGLLGTAYHLVTVPPETAGEAFLRAGGNTVTLASMGAIFGITTCLLAEARDAPDDLVNYFVGGCAAGIVLGARTRSAKTGTIACGFLGSLGVFGKAAKNEDWVIINRRKM